MTGQVSERAMSEAEQEDFRSRAQTRFAEIKSDVLKDLAICGVILLLGVVIWLAVSWLVRPIMGSETGWDSVAAPWIRYLGGFAGAIFPVVLSVWWFKRLFDRVSSVRVDLEKKRVVEEKYEFSAAIRMREQEHGGLMYFLRTSDGTVLVLFDYESQDLGTNGEDPLTSRFQPRTQLTLVRAAESGTLIETTFSGDVLYAGEPQELTAPPDKWPEFGEVCNIPWQELEARLCR